MLAPLVIVATCQQVVSNDPLRGLASHNGAAFRRFSEQR
jgi:hypothetical protein